MSTVVYPPAAASQRLSRSAPTAAPPVRAGVHRRQALLGIAAGVLSARTAEAQTSVTTKLVVPYAPGGAIDTIGRLIARSLATSLGEIWVVENRTGGNGVIGTRLVAGAPPDGHTLMFHADAHIVANLVMRDPGFDARRDFTPVARVAQGPLVLVGHPSLRARTLAELVRDLRAAPDRFSFANSSLGALGHLATEWFKTEIGTPNVTVASYRGTAPAIADVLSGNPQLMMAPLLAARPLVEDGRLRAYAICAANRSPIVPSIPTGAEQGMPGLRFVVWYGMWGQRDLPETVVMRLNDAVRAAVQEPVLVARLAELGCEPVIETAAGFQATVAAEYERNARIIRAAGILPE
ncbi:Bug family tripartite tricarboxylate transporter substrate binding protein [Roseomonas gilardii]|uniref:Bug family tripartite tricarboxylate transporter substrate binding protein n=1 Tax=Roseomonas gilardii TaxID=257708 RepID=UPI0009DE0232|nr:tripartite tricarboxylate transporter substrate-binding protein [Roseomonas gilardii]